jgi:hypothetical protein
LREEEEDDKADDDKCAAFDAIAILSIPCSTSDKKRRERRKEREALFKFPLRIYTTF